MSDASHRVLRLWIRPTEGAPPVEVDTLELVAGKGIVGDHAFGRLRHVTIVFADDWARATDALGVAVDPVARRANVLVSGSGGERLARASLALGGALLDAKGLLRPCPVMERGAPGLMAALRPEGRAGIWARVRSGGAIRGGDALVALRSPDPSRSGRTRTRPEPTRTAAARKGAEP